MERAVAPNEVPAGAMRYVVHCEEKWCYYHVGARTLEDAEELDHNHGCPRTGVTSNAWSVVMPGVVYLWEEIDKKFDEFNVMPATDPRKGTLGAEMRGMCNALSYFMKPYYPTGNEVVAEIMARAQARAAGEKRNTAGIGNVIGFPATTPGQFTQSMDQDTKDCEDGKHNHGGPGGAARPVEGAYRPGATAARSTGRTRTTTPAAVAKKEFTDDEKSDIIAAHAAGFDIAMLTTAYSCTLEDLRSILG